MSVEKSWRQNKIHTISRMTVALVWIYQGLVPKLIARHADELAMLANAGISDSARPAMLIVFGVAEVLFGLATLIFFRRRWPLIVTIVLMGLAMIGAAIHAPRHLVAAFNPVSLNLLLAAMAWIGLLAIDESRKTDDFIP